jgi:cytochrome c551
MRIKAGRALCFLVAAFWFLSVSCSTKSDSPDTSSAKFRQYFVHGEQLYIKHCSNCHQKNGTGLGRLYPPLKSADFVAQNSEKVICLIRYGKKGEVIVNGIQFNKPMPGVSSLSDLEVAEITTYISNNWGNERGMIEVKDVSKILAGCQPVSQ